MKIHHATAARAEAAGIALNVVEFGEGELMVKASWPERAVELHYADAPGAVNAMLKVQQFMNDAEDDGIKFSQQDDGEGELQYRIDNADGCLALEYDLDAAITTATENLSEGTFVDGETGEQLDEDAEGEGGSVVKDVFKQRYKEAGRKQDCGDWLALQLESITHVVVQDGEKETTIVDMDRLQTLLGANDVDYQKYLDNNAFNRGWQGRFRMTTRMILAKRVADKGFLFVPGELAKDGADEERKAPATWCKANATKVKEDKPKRAKATKKADAK